MLPKESLKKPDMAPIVFKACFETLKKFYEDTKAYYELWTRVDSPFLQSLFC